MTELREKKKLDLGKCKFCGATIYWIRTAKNNRPMPLEFKQTRIIDQFGEVQQGHEPHYAHCPNYPKK